MEKTVTDHLPEVLRNAPILLVVCNSEGKITLAQGQLLDNLGADSNKLVGRSLIKLREVLPINTSDIERALSGKSFSRVCEHGQQTYELRYTPQFGSAKALNQVICLGFDVSGRQVSEETWRASEKRFQNAFSHAAIGFALIGIDGRFIRTNPALLNTLGRAAEDLETITAQDLLLHEDQKNWRQAVHQLLADAGSDVVIEVRFQSPQGEPRWIQINLSVVRDANNHPLYFFSQYQDIHERKIAEKSLQQYTERLKFIHQLDKSILAARSLNEVGKAIVEEIRHLIPCQRASVTLFDHDMKIGKYLAVFSDVKLDQKDLGEFRFSDGDLELFSGERRAPCCQHCRTGKPLLNGKEATKPGNQYLPECPPRSAG